MRILVLGLGLLCSCAALATQDASGFGTAVVGEQEAAIGLFIAPWQEESASNVDRPPRLYDLPLKPLDPNAFAGRVRAWQQIEDYRRSLLSR